MIGLVDPADILQRGGLDQAESGISLHRIGREAAEPGQDGFEFGAVARLQPVVEDQLLVVAEFTAQVASGRTNLDFDLPPQQVAASSAAVTLPLPAADGAYGVEVHTRSGTQEIQVPTDPASERQVTVSTSSGRVEVRPR
jgi:hypothetical protein